MIGYDWVMIGVRWGIDWCIILQDGEVVLATKLVVKHTLRRQIQQSHFVDDLE